MGTMIIDGRKVEFTDEKNVLSVIRNAGINIPTIKEEHLLPAQKNREMAW